MSRNEELIQLFKEWSGESVCRETPICDSASNRSYVRLEAKASRCVATVGEVPEENRAFIELTRHFSAKELPVPELYRVSTDQMCYLQEDLGDQSLYATLDSARASGVYADEQLDLLRATMRELVRFQFIGADGLDFSVCYPRSVFDRRSMMWDLAYCKYAFLKPTVASLLEDRLEDEFELLLDRLLAVSADVFVHRDFQARNVMIRDSAPYFIDYQGGRRGAFYYDLASFVFQARAAFPDSVKQVLIDTYYDALQQFCRVDRSAFDENLPLFALFRTLQLLGAYGYRGLFEGKEHFVSVIPAAVQQLGELLSGDFDSFPYLNSLVAELKEHYPVCRVAETSPLVVDVFSFSYKKGYPVDESGNGGGFVFDCRAMHNPGRYDQYKTLTGRDRPVIDFLESRGEVQKFLASVRRLANSSVERYIERGFTHLQFSFGCTGGQHRSVYCAEALAAYLRNRYPIVVRLHHREQEGK